MVTDGCTGIYIVTMTIDGGKIRKVSLGSLCAISASFANKQIRLIIMSFNNPSRLPLLLFPPAERLLFHSHALGRFATLFATPFFRLAIDDPDSLPSSLLILLLRLLNNPHRHSRFLQPVQCLLPRNAS